MQCNGKCFSCGFPDCIIEVPPDDPFSEAFDLEIMRSRGLKGQKGLRSGGELKTDYYVKNREAILKRQKAYYLRNREKIIAYNKARYWAKKEVSNLAKEKIQITMDEELVKRLDDWAAKNYVKRSSLVTMAVAQYLNQFEALRILKGYGDDLRKIADSGVCTPEQMKALEDWGKALDILVGKE